MERDNTNKSPPRIDVNLPKQSLAQDMGDWLAERLADGEGYGRKHPDRVFMSRVLGDLTKMYLDSDSEKQGNSSKNKTTNGHTNAHTSTSAAMSGKKDGVSKSYHSNTPMTTPNGDRKSPSNPGQRTPNRVTICEPPNPKSGSGGRF